MNSLLKRHGYRELTIINLPIWSKDWKYAQAFKQNRGCQNNIIIISLYNSEWLVLGEIVENNVPKSISLWKIYKLEC